MAVKAAARVPIFDKIWSHFVEGLGFESRHRPSVHGFCPCPKGSKRACGGHTLSKVMGSNPGVRYMAILPPAQRGAKKACGGPTLSKVLGSNPGGRYMAILCPAQRGCKRACGGHTLSKVMGSNPGTGQVCMAILPLCSKGV